MPILGQKPTTIKLGKNFTKQMWKVYQQHASEATRTETPFDEADDLKVRLRVDGIDSDWKVRTVARYSHGGSYDFLLAAPLEESLLDHNIFIDWMIRLVYDVGAEQWFMSTSKLLVQGLTAYEDEIVEIYSKLPLKKPELAA